MSGSLALLFSFLFFSFFFFSFFFFSFISVFPALLGVFRIRASFLVEKVSVFFSRVFHSGGFLSRKRSGLGKWRLLYYGTMMTWMMMRNIISPSSRLGGLFRVLYCSVFGVDLEA